ncbi:tyrosine-protein phosphatase [Verrucosispora sp. TAA-831]|uniref:tyrosine-protein phosphatase n=1 Tax=Verrucosispora sp. TAA-831 TaxID=3422227 RepID=UPI003D6F81A0
MRTWAWNGTGGSWVRPTRGTSEFWSGAREVLIEAMRRVHGPFDAYLRAGLGVTDETVAAVRAHLLE